MKNSDIPIFPMTPPIDRQTIRTSEDDAGKQTSFKENIDAIIAGGIPTHHLPDETGMGLYC